MMKIGIISDTHGHWDSSIERFFAPCQEIWHAGDIGALALADQIAGFRPLRAVYGNIDDATTRREYPEELFFEVEGATVYIRHIGGHPGHYAPGVAQRLKALRPTLFVCGHSHILRVINDHARGVLYINPGAYGLQGFHHVRTAIRLEMADGRPHNLEVLELPRG